MSTRKLAEHGALLESKNGSGKFRVRIITEGKGSSGVYSRELLENYKDVFAGRPMFLNHPKDASKPWERDVRDIAGRISPQVEYAVEDGVAALYADVSVDARWRDFIAEYADVIGVSIYASGEGREENGEYIVESFDGDDPYTSVDWVVAAGRGGRVERMLESYRQIEASATEADDGSSTEGQPKDNSKEITMEISELAGKVDKVLEALTALTEAHTTLAEALKPAEVETPEVDLASVVESAVEAGLPKESRDVVVESVKAGAAPEAAIAAQKALVESIRRQVEAAVEVAEPVAGRVVESGQQGGFSLAQLGKVTR